MLVETSGKVKVATGLTTQGQGHQTVFAQIVADELGRADGRRRGGHRRHPAVRLRGRHIRLACRGDERHRRSRWRPGKAREKALRVAADALEADPEDLEIVDGMVRVEGDRRAPRSRWARWPCCRTRCATRSTTRPQAATQFAVGRRRQAAGGRGRRAGPGGTRLLLADAVDVRQRHARGDRRDRPGDRRDQDPALLRGARLRHG